MIVHLIYHPSANKNHSELIADAKRIFNPISHMVRIDGISIAPCQNGPDLFKTGYVVEVSLEKISEHNFLNTYRAVKHAVQQAAAPGGIVQAGFASRKADRKQFHMEL